MLYKCHGCFKYLPSALNIQLKKQFIKIEGQSYIIILQNKDNGIISPLMCISCYQKAQHIEWTTCLEKQESYNNIMIQDNNIIKDPRPLIEKFYRDNKQLLVCF